MNNPMQSKVCLVTGATAGIGEVAALELARMGATLVLVGRSEDKCDRVAEIIRTQAANSQVDYLVADLSSQEQIRRLSTQFQQRYERLDVLLNNAGGYFLRRLETVDGIEMTFGLNHLNYFLLTNLLLDMMKASAPARIVNVASGGHKGSPVDFDNLQTRGFFNGRETYGRSKFANILFTYELARRLDGTGVTANAVHPGWVATNIGKNNGVLFRIAISLIQKAAISREEGARTLVYLSSSPEVEGVTGKYFYKKKAIHSDPATYDEQSARRLWQISAEMTGLNDPMSG